MKVEQTNFVTHLIMTAVLDPDLEIRWGGRSSSPLHKGGRSLKIFFSALRASVWSQNKGGAGPPGPSPRSATVQSNYIIDYLRTLLLKFGQITFKW